MIWVNSGGAVLGRTVGRKRCITRVRNLRSRSNGNVVTEKPAAASVVNASRVNS
jgi:hypothetical protein